MSKLSKVIALLLLGFWGVASMHCRLEPLPGLDFLNCCAHEETTPHQDNDCAQDSCAVVESGFCKLDQAPVSAPSPQLMLLNVTPLSECVCPGSTLETPPTPPPELPRCWQFSHRAALPPRAPSLSLT